MKALVLSQGVRTRQSCLAHAQAGPSLRRCHRGRPSMTAAGGSSAGLGEDAASLGLGTGGAEPTESEPAKELNPALRQAWTAIN